MIALVALVASSPTPQPRVYAGVYLSDISGFDLKEGRFEADLQVWVKWRGAAEPPPIQLVNGEVAERTEVARENDGDWRSVRWRVQGTFRGTFPLQDFPFDTQEIPIELGLPVEHGRLLPDLSGSGMADRFSVTGWLYEPWFRAEVEERRLPSDLGSVALEGRPHASTVAAFVVELRRPLAAYAIKFMVPLGIILAMALLAAFIPPPDLEVRSGIGVTALLSCVAFHVSQADSLPEVSYLVSADKLFLGSYVLILLTLIETVVAYRMIDRVPALSRRLDVAARVAVPFAALAGALVILYAPKAAATSTPPMARPAPPVSARSELRVATNQLASLNTNNFFALVRRGLLHLEPSGERRPHLVVEAPAMTNDLVRFLPDGGMRVRWTLREGVRFSDGTPITPADVAFSASIYDEPGRAAVTIVDERSTDVVYRDRRAAYLKGFVLHSMRALEGTFEKGGFEAITKRLTTDSPPGDGPYVLQSFEPNVSAVFVMNPYFDGPRPAIETIRFRAYATSVDSANALLAGEVDFIYTLSMTGVDVLAGKPGVTVASQNADLLAFLQPDVSRPPFDDARVRRALLLGLDRQAIAERNFGPYGRIAHGYRDEKAADHVDTPRLPYDLAKAKALLAEALPRGAGKVTLFALEADANTPHMRTVEAIRSDLRALGFEVELVVAKSVLDRVQAGDHGGLVFFSRRDPSGIAPYWNVPYAKGRWQVSLPIRLFDEALVEEVARHETTLFEERQRVISGRLQRAFAEKLPILPLAFGSPNAAHVTEVAGYSPGGEASPWWNVERWHFRVE
jgi:ABC-type transport system substrate-binding protein